VKRFFCLFLNTEGELTDEREEHIRTYHFEVAPFLKRIGSILTDPEEVRQSVYDAEVILFYKFFSDVRSGNFLVVVVKKNVRSFILTYSMTTKIRGGTQLWKRG